MPYTTRLAPRLIVPDPDAASAFYQRTLEAEQVFRGPAGDDGRPVVIELRAGASSFRVSPSVAAWGWSPPAEDGTPPVLIEIETEDPDAVASRMTTHGAETVVPIENRPYGKRSGRIRDPYGHLWIITGPLR
ncbi:VOC family protein [Actinomadura flavalba]|uniref:VOC family protein n=1 Tax=Actinomadura flavalba TaxID=1120938 RepID=UPI000376FEDF|nr:VOC family protein [Actinomadura flavalba]